MQYNNQGTEPRRRIFKAIFLDGSFLFKCSQSLNIRINYKKLIQLLLHAQEQLQVCSYYTALPNEYDMEEKHRTFLKILKKDIRIRVRSVPLLKTIESPMLDGTIIPSHRYSKGEDILLATDLVRGAYCNQWDSCVIVTGDADFIPAIQAVMDAGKHVTVASFHNSLSHALEMECSEVIYLDEYIEQIRL